MAEKKRGPGRPAGSKNKIKATDAGNANKKHADRKSVEKKAQTKEKREPSRIRDEIWASIIIALGIFLIIALQTSAAGELGNFLSNILKGSFGLVALGLPYYLIIYGLLLFAKKTVHLSGRSIILLFVIFFMICILNASLYIDAQTVILWPIDFTKLYQEGVALIGGGFFGMILASFLIKGIGNWGLWIFSVVIIFICLLLILNTPLSIFFESLKEKRKARKEKEDSETYEEAYEETYESIPILEMKDVFENFDDDQIEPDVRTVSNNVIYRDDSNLSDNQKKILMMVEDDSLFGQRKERIPGKGLDGTIPDIKGFGLQDEERASNPFPSNGPYKFPPLNLLNEDKKGKDKDDSRSLKVKAKKLEETLKNFNVAAKVIQVIQGPTVTRYEIQPDLGVKVNSITRLADDIALNLEAKSIRIEAPIPGKAAVGIEVDNEKINLVPIREMLASQEFKNARSKIAFAIGKDLSGTPVIADIKEMPHLLIAGSTGSGKSVCINSIITSLLYRAKPEEVKLILIDPKVVELGRYNGIPHLLTPVVTDPSKAAAVLNWAVSEMTERYKNFAEASVRDLESYNERMDREEREGRGGGRLPQIVIIVDELADLMMAAPSQVEESICRLAQMARAAGMHLIVATQRPSVDIITGVIKANIPSRIAFAVASQFDSRTILDMSGAEKLLGKGDMLYSSQNRPKPIRVQGSYISDNEVTRVIDFIKDQGKEAHYEDKILEAVLSHGESNKLDEEDEFFDEAVETVVRQGQASVSMLQRRFRVGYNRAARMIDMMEDRRIIGPQDGSRSRQVLWTELDLYGGKDKEEED